MTKFVYYHGHIFNAIKKLNSKLYTEQLIINKVCMSYYVFVNTITIKSQIHLTQTFCEKLHNVFHRKYPKALVLEEVTADKDFK